MDTLEIIIAYLSLMTGVIIGSFFMFMFIYNFDKNAEERNRQKREIQLTDNSDEKELKEFLYNEYAGVYENGAFIYVSPMYEDKDDNKNYEENCFCDENFPEEHNKSLSDEYNKEKVNNEQSDESLLSSRIVDKSQSITELNCCADGINEDEYIHKIRSREDNAYNMIQRKINNKPENSNIVNAEEQRQIEEQFAIANNNSINIAEQIDMTFMQKNNDI